MKKVHVGKRISEILDSKGVDNKDIAELLRMTTQNVRYIKRKQDVSTALIFQLSEFLHVDPCVFIRKVESSSTEISVNEPQAAYGTVENDSKDKIIKVLESENAMLKDYVETLKRVTKKDGY